MRPVRVAFDGRRTTDDGGMKRVVEAPWARKKAQSISSAARSAMA